MLDKQRLENDNLDFIKEDLAKSGLTPEDIKIEPLESVNQLFEHLGFSKLGDIGLLGVGGYFIEYPNDPKYKRLKLRKPIEDCKYLSPSKTKGFGNKAYILESVREICKDYKPDKPIIFTEGEKKTACAVKNGFPTIGLSGVWNFKDSENDFLPELEELNFKHRKCFICFDSDIDDKTLIKQAELRLAALITNRGGIPFSVRLPNYSDKKVGLDDFIVKHGKEKFDKLLSKAKSTFESHISEGTPTDIILKEAARINSSIEQEKIHKQIAKLENISLDSVRKEVIKHSQIKQEKKDEKEFEVYNESELKEAEDILKSPDILEKMLALTSKAGYVGEDINKKILFLIFISRLLSDSLSCIVKGSSASGKSSLVQTILNLVPKENVLAFSFLTAKALVHSDNDLSHKILFVQEHKGSQSADYSIRTSLSEKELSIMIPVKDEITGNFTSISKSIKADGLVFVETTTRERVHPENQTRVFDLFVDESPEQTEKILFAEAQCIKDKRSLDTELKVWRASKTLLQLHEVVIPYATDLVPAFPKGKLRVRRDFKRFLSLIRAHALLYQYQRERREDGTLIATISDLEAILPLAEVVLGQSLKEISPKQEKVLKIIQEEFGTVEFTLKELNEKTSQVCVYRTLQRYIDFFVKEGWVEWNGQKAKDSRYTLTSAVTSCRETPFSSLNFSTLLENTSKDSRQNDLSSNVANDVKDATYDIHDNSRQSRLSSKIPNNDNQLTPKKAIDDITTQQERKHSEACDCQTCVPDSDDDLTGELEWAH